MKVLYWLMMGWFLRALAEDVPQADLSGAVIHVGAALILTVWFWLNDWGSEQAVH